MIIRQDLWVPVVVVASALCASISQAFVVPPPPVVTTITTATRQPSSSSFLSSSGNFDDDEISKLIGKRNQIKRKKKEEPEPPTPTEPTVDLDLDKLPEFKTERPVRRAKKANEEENEDKDDSDKKKPDVPIVDFLADYEDENDVHIPNRIGVTTVAWGDPSRNFVAKGKLTKKSIKAGKFVPGDLQLAYLELLQGGVTFLETSSSYGAASGDLSGEKIVGRCLAERPDDLPESSLMVSLTSNPGLSFLKSRGRLANVMVNGLEESLQKLNDSSMVEVYSAKKPFWFPSSWIASSLAAVIESGQANAVGVAGVTNPSKLRKLQRLLRDQDTSLSTASFDFALTNPKLTEFIEICKDESVIPLCTNPLDGGLASGVYTATNPSGGSGNTPAPFTFKELEKWQPLHSVQETVAERVRTRVMRGMRDTQERFKGKYGPAPKINTDITTTQIALNYVIAKGGVPMVEVNTPKQAKEVLGCLGWTLTDEEVDMLESAVALCKL